MNIFILHWKQRKAARWHVDKHVIKMLLDNTEEGLRSVIKEDLSDNKPTLVVNKVSENQMNKKTTKKIDIQYLKLIKTFESFNFLKKK